MKVFGVTGWKNTGKTWLVSHLVSEFTGRGLRVSTIKHTHHAVDLDRPGRDSYQHRAAGAQEVILASGARVAILRELRGAPELPLEDLIARLVPVDLVLVEGFKSAAHAKIETWRDGTADALRADGDATIRAVASDVPLPATAKPVFAVDDIGAIADFIAAEVGL